jgi:hypothetical protein
MGQSTLAAGSVPSFIDARPKKSAERCPDARNLSDASTSRFRTTRTHLEPVPILAGGVAGESVGFFGNFLAGGAVLTVCCR